MFWKKKIASVDMDSCDLCRRCIETCRRGALTVFIEGDIAVVRLKSPDACAGCGSCARRCPQQAIKLIEK